MSMHASKTKMNKLELIKKISCDKFFEDGGGGFEDHQVAVKKRHEK